MQKVMAYLHSQEVDGKRLYQSEVEIIDRIEGRQPVYIVKTADGIKCTAIYNIFTGAYYADDIYGIVDPSYRKKSDMEM